MDQGEGCRTLTKATRPSRPMPNSMVTSVALYSHATPCKTQGDSRVALMRCRTCWRYSVYFGSVETTELSGFAVAGAGGVATGLAGIAGRAGTSEDGVEAAGGFDDAVAAATGSTRGATGALSRAKSGGKSTRTISSVRLRVPRSTSWRNTRPSSAPHSTNLYKPPLWYSNVSS